ncbi:MAG: sigma factor-like helix-turn-helix DNA-binding protein [Candidatus Harrisonbacteria bacterium]|nr:sigma factor-like helix-turn-helix DNA-binding protein [Candidatus Harrisonbacteria bacterium]
MAKTATKKTRHIVEELFKNLDRRQEQILKGRYGLEDGEELTLAELGKIFSVTRERVRQIEASALKEVREKVQEGHLDELIQTVMKKLEKTGGVRKENHLLEELEHFAHDADLVSSFAQQIRFLLEISRSVLYHREDEDLHAHWHVAKEHQDRALKFLNDLVKELKGKKKEVLEKKKFDEFFDEVRTLHKLEKEVAEHYVRISKKFGQNLYGDFGLAEWQEVRPRVARDWIYLVLKKAGKPLHFSKIASEIRKLRTLKKTNTQTIHNELIKDKRFILVGRGMYTLREMDNMPAGTIKEVLIHLIKEHGPMTAPEVTKRVLKNRIFKENTIMFNLQNKKYFKRSTGGKYTLV